MSAIITVLALAVIVLLANVSTLWTEIHRIKTWLKQFGDACARFEENEREIAKHIRSIEEAFNMAVKMAKEMKEKENKDGRT